MSSVARILVIPGDLSGGVDAGRNGLPGAWYVEAGDSAAGIANKAMIASQTAIPPGDLSGGVDAGRFGPPRTRWVEAGDSAAGVANEAMRTIRRIPVIPGDLSGVVNGRCEGPKRARWVEAGDSLRVRGYWSSDQAAYGYRGTLQ